MNGIGNGRNTRRGDITWRASTNSYEQARGSPRRGRPTELQPLGMSLEGRCVYSMCAWIP
jgi:hypothetical protein